MFFKYSICYLKFMKSSYAFLGKLCLFFSLLGISQASLAQVSGKVFRDFNANGTKDNSTTFNEVFEPNIVINAYNSSGTLLATQTTAATGTTSNYTFPATGTNSIPSGTAVRLEFILPNYYFATKGNISNTSVQFVTAGVATTADLGINTPSDYCQSSPFLASTAYVSSPGNTGTNNGLSALPVGVGGSNAPGKVELGSPYTTIGAIFLVRWHGLSFLRILRMESLKLRLKMNNFFSEKLKVNSGKYQFGLRYGLVFFVFFE